MTSDEELIALVDEKAEQQGIPKEKMRAILLPQLRDKTVNLEEFKNKLGVIAETAKTYGEISLSGAPNVIKVKLASATGEMISNLLLEKGEGDEIMDAMKIVTGQLAKLKMIDLAREEVFGKKDGEKRHESNGEETAKVVAVAISEAIKPLTDNLVVIRDQMDQTKKNQMEQLIEKLNDNMARLVESKGTSDGGEPRSAKTIFKEAKELTDSMVEGLGLMGYSIEQDKVTGAQVQQKIKDALERAEERFLSQMADDPQKYAEVLEKKGYRVTGGPMKWEDVEKLLDDQKKKITEEAQEDVRIHELGGIIREAVGGFMGLFQPIVGKWFEEGIDAQANEIERKMDQGVEREVINEETKATSSEPPATQRANS